jgi:hypothetical protein
LELRPSFLSELLRYFYDRVYYNSVSKKEIILGRKKIVKAIPVTGRGGL